MRDNGTEIMVLAASRVCGSVFRETSPDEGMRRQPHFIGCDCGSTDPGPYPIGDRVTAFPQVAIKRDLRLMLLAARQAGVPLLLGSAGTAGGEPHIAVVKDVLYEIAIQDGLGFPLAIIHAEQDKTYLKQRLRGGRAKPLKPAPPFDEGVIDRAGRIVGMTGAEPLDPGTAVKAWRKRRQRWPACIEGIALISLLPGAGLVQFSTFLGYARGGWWGGVLGGLCFALPGFGIMLALTTPTLTSARHPSYAAGSMA